MFFSPQRLPVSWISLCIALVGIAYCGAQAAPVLVSIPCPGTGCRILQDFTLFGISLWWAGVAYFALMALLCLRRAHSVALSLAFLALILDAVLLLIMLATASCTLCLGAGLLIALLFLAMHRHMRDLGADPTGPPLVLVLWSGLFIAAGALALSESIPAWRIAGEETAERRVYFAPSCSVCRDAVTVFARDAAFIPIAEEQSDYAVIYAMAKAVADGTGVAEALDGARKAHLQDTLASVPLSDFLLFRLRLIRNKSEVMGLGFTQLPLIMVNGMPQNLRPAHAPGSTSTPGGTPAAPAPRSEVPGLTGEAAASSVLPPELLSPVDSCGENAPQPCDQPR